MKLVDGEIIYENEHEEFLVRLKTYIDGVKVCYNEMIEEYKTNKKVSPNNLRFYLKLSLERANEFFANKE